MNIHFSNRRFIRIKLAQQSIAMQSILNAEKLWHSYCLPVEENKNEEHKFNLIACKYYVFHSNTCFVDRIKHYLREEMDTPIFIHFFTLC